MPQVGKPSPPVLPSEEDLKVLATLVSTQGALAGDDLRGHAAMRLLAAELVAYDRGKWTLTDAGKEALTAAGLSAPADAG